MKSFRGTLRLVRLAIRRDRITIPLTMLVVVFLTGGGAPALVDAYPTYEDQASYIGSSAPSVVGRIFQGTVQDVSIGSVLMAEVFLFASVIVAIMSILIVSRHTRHNEETGAGELIGSTIVGHNAALSAALIVAIGSNVIIGLLMYATIGSIEEFSASGTAMLAAALAGVGIFFAGVSAITVQLSDYRRGANSMAVGALAGFFILRAIGDSLGELARDGLSVTASWPTWLSPIGWGYQTLPYTQNNVAPLLLLIGGSIVAVTAAFYLQSKRDVGSSIFQAKAGPSRADAALLSASGLAIRIQRGGILGWAIGYSIVGALMGVMVNDFRELFEENELFQNLVASSGGGGSFVENTLAAMFPLFVAMLSGYVVSTAGKISDEEVSGRLEYLQGTAVGRERWLGVNISVALFGAALNLLLMGMSAAISYYIVADSPDTAIHTIALGALNVLPALVLFFAAIILGFALFGRYVRIFAWACYAYIALIGTFTSIFSWPTWTANLSPFNHVAPFPSLQYDILPAIILSGLALSFILFAISFFRRRDLSLK